MNQNDLEIRNEEVKDILSKVPHWMIRWGNLMFLLLILLILLLSWFIKYPDIITAEANLTTEIPPQKEFARISGKIDTLYVKDRQSVEENSILAIIENTANHKDVYVLKSIVDTIKMTRKNILFPFNELPILLLGEIEINFSQFENDYFQYKINKQQDPFSNEILANNVSLAEVRRRLQGLDAQRNLSQNELDFKKKDLDRNALLFQKGVISAQEYENKQLEYFNIERNYQSINLNISQLRETLGNAKNISKGTNYKKIREETQLLKSVIQSFNLVKNAIKEWELKYVLKSKINGQVSFLNYWNTNQNVNAGDLVFTIIPNNESPYISKLLTPKTNSGKIRIGQQVNLSLYDYPEYEFGVIKGRVERISTTSNSQGNYVVDVSIPKDLITSFGKIIVFKQEMRGTADIITEDLRLLERLLYQFREVFNRK
jgi:multidrug resistance efflux pump